MSKNNEIEPRAWSTRGQKGPIKVSWLEHERLRIQLRDAELSLTEASQAQSHVDVINIVARYSERYPRGAEAPHLF